MTLAAKAPEERRRRILLAAIEVLRARGFAGTRVADIAAAAGTSPALVLYHFSSLGEVLVAALTSVDEQFYEDLAEDASADPRDTLVHMADLAAEGGPAFGDWQLWLEVWVRARHDQRIDDVRRSIDRRWRDELTTLIERGVKEGVFVSDDAHSSAIRLSAMLDGLAVQVVHGDEDLSPEQMAALWIDGAARELGTTTGELRDRRPAR